MINDLMHFQAGKKGRTIMYCVSEVIERCIVGVSAVMNRILVCAVVFADRLTLCRL